MEELKLKLFKNEEFIFFLQKCVNRSKVAYLINALRSSITNRYVLGKFLVIMTLPSKVLIYQRKYFIILVPSLPSGSTTGDL